MLRLNYRKIFRINTPCGQRYQLSHLIGVTDRDSSYLPPGLYAVLPAYNEGYWFNCPEHGNLLTGYSR
jgi:hypothetical protein